MKLNEVAQLALELGTPDKVAKRLGIAEDTAAQMITFAQKEQERKRDRERMESILNAEAERARTLSAQVISLSDPSCEYQDFSFRKEAHAMQHMSRELLKAMLRTGQHRLTPEQAAQKKRELGLDLLLV